MNTPEHLHVALNHLPFLGAGFALVPLLIGFIFRQKCTVVAGLILAAASGWLTPVVMETGESAYERYEEGPIAQYLDPQAEQFLELHEHRAEEWSKVLYLAAFVSTVCLVLVLWKPRWLRPLTVVAAVGCAGSLLAGMWIAESGGLIRRPDFRQGDAVMNQVDNHRAEESKEHDEDH